MRVREVVDPAERKRLWDIAVAAYPPYAEYQTRTRRQIPVLVAEPAEYPEPAQRVRDTVSAYFVDTTVPLDDRLSSLS
jgi:hypothetical protein